MKRVEVNSHLSTPPGEPSFDPAPHIYFTEEQKKQIRETFKKTNPHRQVSKKTDGPERERVEEFIQFLEFLCSFTKETLESFPVRKKAIKAVLQNCREALPYLDQIAHRKLTLPSIRNVQIDETTDQQNTRASLAQLGDGLGELERFNNECCRKASDAAVSLRSFIEIAEKCLKMEIPKRGLKSADYLRTEFLTYMAKDYSRCTGELPTTYKDGTFIKLVRIAYNALDFPAIDPSETVRAVVKALKKEKQKN